MFKLVLGLFYTSLVQKEMLKHKRAKGNVLTSTKEPAKHIMQVANVVRRRNILIKVYQKLFERQMQDSQACFKLVQRYVSII